MSRVAIKGNASGTATYTLEAPAGSTDRTLVLPDEAGTVLTSGTDVANFPSGFANGITQADVWRLTADLSSNGDITANLERADHVAFGLIGSGVTESSGIFTFSETGIWEVTAFLNSFPSTNDTHDLSISVSIDGGSNFTFVAGCNTGESTNRFNTGSCSALIDCTNTSNVKVKFVLSSFSSGAATGNTDTNRTHFKFIRLGDT